MSNNKIMTVEEWVAQNPSAREYDAVSRPFYSMQQYAEYYHSEQMKHVGNNAKQMTKIEWENRYSNTMEDDDMGRWARIAYAGNFTSNFIDGKPTVFQIAWISKLIVKAKTMYVIKANFPFSGKYAYDTIKYAQNRVESEFNFFLTQCFQSMKCKPSDAVEFSEWILNHVVNNTLPRMTNDQLYSQFQNEKNEKDSNPTIIG